jgi:hypothetical protein
MPTAPTMLGAVYQLCISSPAITALIPGTSDGGFNVWFGQLPENYSFANTGPGIVYSHLGETPNWSTEPQYLTDDGFILDCMAQTAQQAEAIASAAKATFDQLSNGLSPIVIANAQTVGCLRAKYLVTPFSTRSPTTEFVVNASLTYLFRGGYSLAG